MKFRHNIYIKMNLASIFFIALSFISLTLAWFAYSGLSNVSTEIGVKAWNIELNKNGEKISNDIVISLSEIYPGMDVITEKVNIKNLGDSDAQIKYSIISARILAESKDNYVVNGTTVLSEYVEDVLSHNYPFHINMSLDRPFVASKEGETSFEVSISWPLDSESNEEDSLWGNAAYQFQKSEEDKKKNNQEYQIRPAIQIVLTLTAEQYVKTDNASDTEYNLGDTILFDVASNSRCTTVSSTCLETYVIDVNNRLGDETVTLLPNPNEIYLTSNYYNYSSTLSTITNNWTVTTRPLLIEDILRIVSKDIVNSVLIRDNISDLIIGNLSYGTRINTELNRAISYNGYYSFNNERFNFLMGSNCYWTFSQYNASNGFAVRIINQDKSKIYNEAKTSTCNIVPVVLADKDNLK